jgi:hypothetical protein
MLLAYQGFELGVATFYDLSGIPDDRESGNYTKLSAAS